MARTLSSGMVTVSESSALAPFFLVEMYFTSGYVRVWSGLGQLTWNSVTWEGVGNLGTFEPLAETQDFVANGANLRLSGIPSDMIAIALGQHYQGRPASIYFGAMDSAGAVIVDPVKIYAANMDTMEIDEQGETCSIIIRIESEAVSLKRAREWRYTHEDQQIDYPGDLGFEYVASLQDKDIIWKPA